MWRAKIVVLTCLLAGCSLGPLVGSDVLDYFEVNDLAANRIILLNMLRAKDGAPLHFSELSLVRGQITAGATAGVTFPFGPLLHASTPRNGASASATVSSSPSFDVGSLDTQDFTRGVMAPIAPETVKFFLDEGVDYRLVFLLLVSGVRTPGNQEIIFNAPESTRDVCYSAPIQNKQANFLPDAYTIVAKGDQACPAGHWESEFFGFLRVINHLRRLYATTYTHPPEPVGAPFVANMHQDLRALTAMDPAKYRLRKLPDGQFQLFAAQRHETIVLCQEPLPGGVPSVLVPLSPVESPILAAACAGSGGRAALAAGVSERPEVPELDTLRLRSTLEVIQYIGRLLEFQEDETARLGGSPRCVTLNFETQNPGCTGNILFHLVHDGAGGPISLDYGGRNWAIPPPRACSETQCNHSLETMAIVSLLLNQNKSAKDIPSTPAFEAVP